MTQLSKRAREKLLTFAARNIKTPEETTLADKLYEETAPLVRAFIDTDYPPAEMAVLKKYMAGRWDSCINAGYRYDLKLYFNFRDGDENIPYLPNGTCSSRSFVFPLDLQEKVLAYNQALEAEKDARKKKLATYNQLIMSCRRFNDLVKAWPAAEALRAQIAPANTALALPTSVIDFIKADNAGATLEAAT